LQLLAILSLEIGKVKMQTRPLSIKD